MTSILHLLFSAYFVFTIFDIQRANSQHFVSKLEKDEKSWLHFFIIQQAWSIGTISVVALLTWMFI